VVRGLPRHFVPRNDVIYLVFLSIVMKKKIKIKSPANIAFIKYWGQKDADSVLPYTDSFSMNLSNCYTIVEFEIHDDASKKELFIKDYKSNEFKKASPDALQKVLAFYHTARLHLKVKKDIGFTIKSENSFPKKAGIASSASFFSALALAFATAFGKKLSQQELSVLARLSGSGSACRSVPDGFVWWEKGVDSETSYAYSIAKPDYWDVVDMVLILNAEEKKVGSQEGHKGAESSLLYADRLLSLDMRLTDIKEAFEKKDFKKFGKLIEEETLSMHMVMMTQSPQLYFWSGKTLDVMKKTIELRNQGIDAFYTIDAGENVHIICEKKNEKKVYDYFSKQDEVQEIIVNYPTIGVRVVEG
jgi:diphosphomevalonate decarboxylase